MSLLESIKELIPNLNEDQVQAITSTDGPVLIVAGPGTGKTLTLVLRAMYIILTGRAEPKEIMLTTFTEKAAFELRDRINQIARQLGYKGQMHELKVGTIHSLCDKFISEFLSHTQLGKNYTILEDLTQVLFVYEHFEEIFLSSFCVNGKYLGRWQTKWDTIKGIIPYFNKITEELIDVRRIEESKDDFLSKLSSCYSKYETLMIESNKLDFAHLQKVFLELLSKEEIREKIGKETRYLMVDEYQDTNHIQEMIFLELAKPHNNLCVVGDDDQALYRFRGATVRNILEFKDHFDYCEEVRLTTNYRSHREIIDRYNSFMSSIDWQGLRFAKQIVPDSRGSFPEYPAVFCVWGTSKKDEAKRICHMIKFLKENKVIQDYSDVALLMSSIRIENSSHYIDAFRNEGIPFFAPRAKAYFENEEVQMLISCYALLFGFYGDPLETFAERGYVEDAIKRLKAYIGSPLSDYLQRKAGQIESLVEGSLELTLLDFLYQLLAYRPFSDYLRDENKSRNLSTFSNLLSVFQDYYKISIVTAKNKKYIKYYLFGSFLHFLLRGGIDDYEDPDNPIPKGFVQIMTIHQCKGLEFPVTIVDSLDKSFRVMKQVDRDLAPFSPRGTLETEKQMTEFDRMRHFYVAFSRPQRILVLSTTNKPQPWFSSLWEGLDQWPYVKQKTLGAQRFTSRPQFIPKKTYSLSNINVYETCPQQYLLYREYGFQPSRSAQMLFGALVHETIESVHDFILESRSYDIDTLTIERWFDANYRALLASGLRPIHKTQKELALKQVVNYYKQNRELFEKLQETEVDVSVEKDDYILVGKIDLLLGKDASWEYLISRLNQNLIDVTLP
jgi:DNA helicase-2/ATP-dependent DNA helicase PcrA